MSIFRMRNLILHIGDPKTGTSSIQRALQLELVASPNVKVAGYFTEQHRANAVGLARAFQESNKRKIKPLMRDVKAWFESSNADFSIISSEFFAEADPLLVRRAFTKALSRSTVLDRFPLFSRRNPVDDIRVIAYVRPHSGRLLSSFIERVRNGYTLSVVE